MKAKKLLSIIAIAFIALISGCAKDDFQENIGVCPVVISTSPENGAINVSLDKTIVVTFNEDMNASTINKISFTLQGTTAIEGTVLSSGKTATFNPSAPLKPNATYTAKVTTAVKDRTGNALQQDYVWTFSTGSSISPMVVSTDPADKETGVFPNKIVSALFNMQMNESTINASTVTINQGGTAVQGTVSYSGTTVYFDPTQTLTPNTIYTGTITTGAKNVQGTALAKDYIWMFTTGTISAPKVILTDPTKNATNVDANKIVSATFSMPMNLLTINATSFTLKIGIANVEGLISYNLNGDVAYFTPASNLLPNTTYTATITTAAKSATGIPLANEYVWDFSTMSSLVGPGVDLGSAERFGILAGVGVSNNAGFSEIRNLDVGIYPGARSSVTGFPPAKIIGGAIYASDDLTPPGTPAMLKQAKLDLTNAYLFAEGASYSAPITISGDQGGKTLVAGIYKSTSTLLVQAGDLTLTGNANDVWIFQIASAFTTVGGAGGNIILAGGAQAKNVYWQTGSSATIGNYTNFKGNVLALQSITMGDHAKAIGRMLARNGAVVMTHTNIITKP